MRASLLALVVGAVILALGAGFLVAVAASLTITAEPSVVEQLQAEMLSVEIPPGFAPNRAATSRWFGVQEVQYVAPSRKVSLTLSAVTPPSDAFPIGPRALGWPGEELDILTAKRHEVLGTETAMLVTAEGKDSQKEYRLLVAVVPGRNGQPIEFRWHAPQEEFSLEEIQAVLKSVQHGPTQQGFR